MEVSKNIFRNYDIRGIYPTELDENISFYIGKSLGSLLVKKEKKRVIVGRDDRESSPQLSEALIKGLLDCGCDVYDTGITLTPIIHFLTNTEDFDLGIEVTASHNPKEYNGFRIDLRNAKSFYGDLILMIRFMIERETFSYGIGTLQKVDYQSKYIDYMLKHFSFKKKFKVVIDCGSGASSLVAPELFKAVGCEVVPVFCNYDSNFPRGVPDPENTLFMRELRDNVLANKADVGFAYDTDGDRFGMVDEKGTIYETDESLMLFAEDILKRKPGSTIVFDVKSSLFVEKVIKELGGVPKIIRTGHPYFANEVGHTAVLGAEFSGHVFFADDYFGFDDGLYASLRVLRILEQDNNPLSTLMAKYPKGVSTNELKIACPDHLKFKVVNLLKIYVMNNIDYRKMIDIDGIRVHVTDTSWFLIRASNTTPLLSLRAEGKDEEELNNTLEIIRNALKTISIVKLNIGF